MKYEPHRAHTVKKGAILPPEIVDGGYNDSGYRFEIHKRINHQL